jgi:hypothetical protein
MIVVDSSVWISNIRRIDTAQVQLLRSARQRSIIAGDIVVLEVLRGVRDEREAARQHVRFKAYGITPMLSPSLALAAAAKYRKLRALGITVSKTVDLIVATFCIEGGHHLLHQDRDFDHFEVHLGLRIAR